jgi:hypothetical protein
MVRAAPKVTRRGTAADLANLGVGYSASGASEHTRQAAHSTNVKMRSYEEPAPPKWHQDGPTLGEKIADQAKKLAALHMRLRFERDPERCEKVRKNIEIKTKYLAKLKSEQLA